MVGSMVASLAENWVDQLVAWMVVNSGESTVVSLVDSMGILMVDLWVY